MTKPDPDNVANHQPQIANIEFKRRKSSGVKLLVILFAVILVLMISGRQLLALFLPKEDEPTKQQEIVSETTSSKRKDLGTQIYNPLTTQESDDEDEAQQQSIFNTLSPNNSVKTGFQKYRNISHANRNDNSRLNEKSEKTSTDSASIEVQVKEPPQVEVIKFDPNLYLEEGTFIPCTLRTRFISQIAGKISCVISQNVYSANGNTVLIEAGTKATGSYKASAMKFGESRMFIAWENLRTPDYKKINFYSSQVVGELGEAGIDGWVDTHFWERFGNAMLLSVVDDVAVAVTDQINRKDRNVDYTANSRDAFAEMAKMTLENSINIPPTIYKNQGDVIGILVGEDIDFSNVYQLRIVQ